MPSEPETADPIVNAERSETADDGMKLHRHLEWTERMSRDPYDAPSPRPRRKRCIECNNNWADLPSQICPGYQAYQEHMR